MKLETNMPFHDYIDIGNCKNNISSLDVAILICKIL